MRDEAKLSSSFAWLNATQFLSALSDNVFKLLATFYVIHRLGEAQAGLLTSIGALLFALPFILFLPACGILADRMSKRDLILWANMAGVGVALVAVAGFALSSVWITFLALFLSSVQSAMFGPAKYGIIPELAPKELLSRANGLIVGATYLAIVIGTMGGGWLREVAGDNFILMGWVCVGLAIAGAVFSIPIERVPPAGTERRASILFFLDAWSTIKLIRSDRFLLLAVLASAYFSLIGAFIQANVIPFGIQRLGLTDAQSGMLFLYVALGIGVGSVLAGRLSGRNIEFGVLPLAALGLGLTSAALALGTHSLPSVKTLLFLAGVSAGLYIVPLDAFVQWRAPKGMIGEVIAAQNWLGWIGVLLAAVVGIVIYGVLKLSPAIGFGIVGLLTLALTAVTVKLLPDFLIRFVAVFIARLFYRIKAIGLENLPVEGGALLISNHVSFMDAPQILATQQRRIRFMMHRSIYDASPLRPLFKLMGVIPIAMEDPPKKIIEALHAARQALDDGFMVCIFAEGALTRNGLMHGFKPGFERIVRGSNYPIIPIYVGGAWGSIFSHYHGTQQARIPARIPYPVTVIFGAPMPATSKATEVRQRIVELSCDYFEDIKGDHRSMGKALIAVARKNWKKHSMSDTSGKSLTYGRALTGAVALARALRGPTRGLQNIGILLPPSVGGALVNMALALMRKVAVNLNFTASKDAFASALQQADVRTIITSKLFTEKMPEFAALPGLVYIEDILRGISGGAKFRALLAARLAPACLLTPLRGAKPDDTATIIFSSGTTGEPKGVVLSQHNVLSNVLSVSMVFRPRRDDNICAALPLFHSFGFTCGLWFPILAGMAASYHTSPLDGAKIAEVVRTHKCTALFATPTFLMSYLRRASVEDFKCLRQVVVGAEKLKPKLAAAFEEKFGFRPLEGFGATELSPVAALSLHDVEVTGIIQAGTKPGSVGQPVPGVAVRIVDPDTYAPKPTGENGLLLVKGPNVMMEYLGNPAKTTEAIRDGWYVTGDIAMVDEDGFIFITDRLARFSKIAGEMVPHLAIEEEFTKVLNMAEAVLAVASVPDDRKGERLVVLYTHAAGDPATLQSIMEKSSLPNLWKPGRGSYYRIDAVPVTGSGKLDVKTLRQWALEHAAAAAEPEETPK